MEEWRGVIYTVSAAYWSAVREVAVSN